MNHAFASAASEIARDAGRFLKRFSEAHTLSVESKDGANDFVTNADRESQRMIARQLRERFPGHRFIGEEDGLSDAEIAQMLSGDDYFWVADPLDGTINYIHRTGIYSVSIGLIHRGTAVAGAICLPETGEVFSAARGKGAWLNGRAIHVSECAALSRAFVATDYPVVDMAARQRHLKSLARTGMRVSNLRVLGSCCAALALVACGRLDAYWNLGCHLWDAAAGIVLVEEAGGAVSDVRGEPPGLDMSRGIMACAPGIAGELAELTSEVL